MRVRNRSGNRSKPTLGVGALAVTAVTFGLAAVLLSAAPGAAQSGPPDAAELMARLECDERSMTDGGETAYEIASPPDYPEGYRSGETPESLAAGFAGALQLDARVPAREEIYQSAERVDVALKAADGRTIGIVTTVNHAGGWRQGGGITCAPALP